MVENQVASEICIDLGIIEYNSIISLNQGILIYHHCHTILYKNPECIFIGIFNCLKYTYWCDVEYLNISVIDVLVTSVVTEVEIRDICIVSLRSVLNGDIERLIVSGSNHQYANEHAQLEHHLFEKFIKNIVNNQKCFIENVIS